MSLKTYKKYLTTIGLFWAGCLVVFILAYVIALGPQKKSKEQVKNQLSEIQQRHESILNATKEDSKAALNEEIENLRNIVKDFAADFENSSNLTFDIGQIANEKKVDSFSIKTQENARNSYGVNLKYLQENRIDLSFAGDFKQFASFLNALERNRPIIFVDNFKITRSPTDDSKHRASMKLAVFVRKQQES